MKLGLKPNIKNLSFKELVELFNMNFSEEQNVYIKMEEDDSATLYNVENNAIMGNRGEIKEETLRLYFTTEVDWIPLNR